MSKRVAIYARVSTDKQSETSTVDQVERCRAFAATRGWNVVEDLIFEEPFMSGVQKNRPKLQELMKRIGEWDVLVCWDFDRLGRNEEVDGWIRNRMRLAQREGIQASDGKDIFSLDARIGSVLNSDYVLKVSQHTHRGLAERVRNGYVANRPPFGYTTQAVPSGRQDHHGNEILLGYRMVIVEEHAALVRRIYDLYLGGLGFKAIATKLNEEGVRQPRNSRGWTYSIARTILRNPTYKGLYIWNTKKHIKDPETGGIKAHRRPKEEWIYGTAPAIVDPETWQAAQDIGVSRDRIRKRKADGSFVPRDGAERPGPAKHLLSGFLKCGHCGGSIYVHNGRPGKERMACGRRREFGDSICDNHLRILRVEIEGRVLTALEEQVLVDEVVDAVVDEAMKMVQEAFDTAADETRLQHLERRVERLVELAAELGDVKTTAHKIREAKAEISQIRARLMQCSRPDPERLRRLAREAVMELRESLQASREEGREVLRLLLGEERLTVVPDPAAPGGYWVRGTAQLPVDLPVGGRGSEGTARPADQVGVSNSRATASTERRIASVSLIGS